MEESPRKQLNQSDFFKSSPKTTNLFTAKVKKELTDLQESLDKEKKSIMQKLSPLAEQQWAYRVQIEPMGREKILIDEYLEEIKSSESQKIDLEELKKRFTKDEQRLRTDLIAGQKEFLKSRQQIFDDNKNDYIFLDEKQLNGLLEKFIAKLDVDLKARREHFIEFVDRMQTIQELKIYSEALRQKVDALNEELDELTTRKYAFENSYNDKEDDFTEKRHHLLGQALLEGVKKNDMNACQYLIQEKTDINFQDEKGCSGLHLASTPEMMTLLLKAGAKTNLCLNYTQPYDHRGFTPLHIHTLNKALSCVKLLLEANADVEAKSALDVTPLYLAAKINNNDPVNEEIVTLLTNYGANIRARSQKGYFAMGCPAGHKKDKFKKLSHQMEEALGAQAGKGMQAFQQVQKHSFDIKAVQSSSVALEKRIAELEKDNLFLKEQLKKQTQMIEMLLTKMNKESNTFINKNPENAGISPGFF